MSLQSKASRGELWSDQAPLQWGDTNWKERISYIRETPSFYGELSIAATLRLASRLYRTWDEGFAASLLHRFELNPTKHVGHLSKGSAVKLGIVTALAHRAEFLILDEPTSGLDPTARAEMQETLAALRQERESLTLVLSSHIFEDLEHVVDHLVIVRNGAFVFQGAMRELASLALFRVTDSTALAKSPDVRLMWRHGGHLWVAVPRDCPLAASLSTLPDCIEDPQGLTLSALYQGTAHLC
jgi:ABC-type multidrug transport system ATPase subunit